MNRLKILREEKQLLQKDVAEYLGVTQKAISLYETEQRDMSTDILYKLANYFNCSIDYILGKSDVRNPEEIEMNDVDVSFASGIKGLNETNKMIIQNTLEALLAKQEKDDKEKGKKMKI